MESIDLLGAYHQAVAAASSYCQVQFDVVAPLIIQQVSASLKPNVASCLGLFIIKSMAPTHINLTPKFTFPILAR